VGDQLRDCCIVQSKDWIRRMEMLKEVDGFEVNFEGIN
jgi:hypothetical protein